MRVIAGAVIAQAIGLSAARAQESEPALDESYEPSYDEEIVEIVEEAPLAPVEGTTTRVVQEEMRTMAGARGDAIEVVRSLPGVAFAVGGQIGGDLAIRGTSGSDSAYFIDGMAVPNTTHLGGLTAVIPVDLIDGVTLSPGGFDVAYGRATGGVVELETRPARADRWRGAAELAFVHASAYAEGPVYKDKVTLIAGVRRSFLDAVLPAVFPDDEGLAFTQLPVYMDGQLRLDWYAAPRHQFTVLALASDDSTKLGIDKPIDNDPGFTRFETSDRWWRTAAIWKYDGSELDVRTIAAVGRDDEQLDFGPEFNFTVGGTVFTARSDLALQAHKRVIVRAGVDTQAAITSLAGKGAFGIAEGAPPTNSVLDPAAEIDREERDATLAGYAAADVRPVDNLTLTGGVRVDHFTGRDTTVVQPRLAAEHVRGDWTLRATGGRFSRAPDGPEMIAPGLVPETSWQASLGAERKIGNNARFTATAFSSWLRDLTVFDPAGAGMSADPLAGFASTGTGTARGIELVTQVRRDDLFGWFAYTFSQSRRLDAPGEMQRLFDQDQPHNFVAAGSYKLGAWRFGGRFRFASGIPYTPVVGSTYVSDADVYRPTYARWNSARLPFSHQLDLRIDRDFVLEHVKLTAFIDVSNVYANDRVSGYSYDFNYRDRTERTELPLTPSLGLRGEL